jgi:hypothetical protein
VVASALERPGEREGRQHRRHGEEGEGTRSRPGGQADRKEREGRRTCLGKGEGGMLGVGRGARVWDGGHAGVGRWEEREV